jgi:hypothetical protein
MSSTKQEIDPLDALIASPNHHRLLMENDKVRVVETLIPAGERTAIHTHQWAGVLHVKSWSDFVRRDDKDNVLVDTRTNEALRNPAEVLWGPALPPHSLENVGNQTLRIIAVELKE